MDDPDQPISGFGTRLQGLREELSRQLAARTASIPGQRNIVAWYLQYGYASGIQRYDLEQMLVGDPELLEMAKSLSDEEVSAGKPSPEFDHGDTVEVIVNAKNTTYHKGHVRLVQWHSEERQWLYLLEDDQGKKVSKRYLASDLRAIA